MTSFLSKRNEQLTEQMDNPSCNRELLLNTYKQFSKINRLLSGWERIYKSRIKPVIKKTSGQPSLLDIGCGGGDIIRYLNTLCRRDGLNVQFTGIDPDKRAFEFLSGLEHQENIRFMKQSSKTLVQEQQRFDIVISNHLMHHLPDLQLAGLCDDAARLARTMVIFSDIERHPIGYAAFRTIAPLLFKNSFIVEDGLTSIRRSFKKQELQTILPDGWKVERQFPFRLLAICNPGKL
jgi:2-polyprenyl-3-methyl-5-hydroxy-6-metoxy-1,4-benzoquinol methylase